MKNKSIVWLYLFLFASICDLALILEELPAFRIYSKPLIVASLMLYFYKISKPISWTILSKSMMMGLFFALLGDVLLLWEKFFLYGIGAFFMTQLCYIVAFKVAQPIPTGILRVNFIRTFLYNLPLYFFALWVYYLIQPQLGSLKIPVILYMVVLVGMVAVARERYKKVNPDSFWQVFIGACLFFISDGMIAISKFYGDFPEADILIMGSYCVAQLLIVMGVRSFLIRPN